MSKIIKIGITKKNNHEIQEVNKIKILSGKGIIGDRYFHEYNDEKKQITLIESENIDYYNKKYKKNIPYLEFRRNIVTLDIELNDLIGKVLKINNTELEAIDLCRPCRHLEEILGCDNIIKEFLRKGGLRCQIINSGEINTGDKIQL